MAGPITGGGTYSGLGGSLGNRLPQLTMETELQKILTDEKTRAEKHRFNYQQLKVEHTRLQDKVLELETENKATIEESRIVKDKYLTMYEACKRDLAEKIAENEELKTKMITPQRLEMMKSQIIDELEKTYREKTNKQESEVEEYRSALTKVRYEMSFLKSEYEHDRAEHQQSMEDLVKQHDLEMSNLRQDRDSTISRVQSETSQDTQKVRVLQRENAQLHLQIKELVSELEEIRAQREKQHLDSDNISRVQSKQIAEQQATIRSLEAEKESLKRQLEHFQKEFMTSSIEHNKLKAELHELEKKNTVLKGHAEEVIYRSKVDLSDLKMEMLKERGELEKDRDKLSNTTEDLKNQLEISEGKIRQLEHMLEEKEREVIHRVQGAREEEFAKMAKIENDKFELETKLQELERRRIDEDTRRHAELEKANDRVSDAMAAKDQAERDLITVKTQLSHMDSLREQLDRERSENSQLKLRVNKLETDLASFNSAENELTDSNLRLKSNAELLREELKLSQNQLEKLQNNHEIILLQTRTAMAEDRAQLEGRLQELEEKLGQSQAKYSRASAIHKKLKKKSAKVSDYLKDKVHVLQAENQELDLEKQALQKCIPADQYNKLKKQWKDLWRRHQEFRTILLSVPSNYQPVKDEKYFPYRESVNTQLDASTALVQTSLDNQLEEEHQEDLRVLKVRLEALDKVQHEQLEQLTSSLREKQDLGKDCGRISPLSSPADAGSLSGSEL